MSAKREVWSSKLGVILAVAGSAIGLGNFLRFPVKAAVFGGGAFLIPYFIALIFLGIPLAWIEWTLGRYGGQFSHGSAPGILNSIVRKGWAKYLGSFGVIGPLIIFFYYTYIESWLFGFAWYSLDGELMRAVTSNTVSEFFGNFITLKTTILHGIPSALFFFLITFLLNFGVIYFGIRNGIELLNKIALPVIFVFGLILLIRVLTIPGIEKGLSFMWNPDFSLLLKPRVWFEASGQVFFTLSVGIGAILTYASYVRKNQDIALSSLTSCAANEFAEVILGGTIVIPMAVVLFGVSNMEQVAKMGTFGLGFNTMPVIFGKMPLASFLQFIWFSLLFFAGLTSSISVAQPAISFLEDEMKMTKKRSVLSISSLCLIMGLIAVFGLNAGAVDEMDFWGGTFSLVLFGTIEAVIFAWVFGIDRAWKELTCGAHVKIPTVFRFILKYVTPVYLIVIFVSWFISDGWNFIMLKGISRTEQVSFLSFSMSKFTFIASLRILLLALLFGTNATILFAWKKHKLYDKNYEVVPATGVDG